LRESTKRLRNGTKLGVFVYDVQNAKAKDLADVPETDLRSHKEKKPSSEREW